MRWRGTVACLALYALLLQAFVAGLTGVQTIGPAGIVSGGGLCSPAEAVSDRRDQPASPHHPGDCCVFLCQLIAGGGLVPETATTSPVRRFTTIVRYGSNDASVRRSKMRGGSSARGPPRSIPVKLA